MADSIIPMPLNRGLDLVTPPLNIESGALIDCLNYELTDIAGYRRVDGYERYDGFPNGAIYDYYIVGVTAPTPFEQNLIVPGTVISRTGASLPRVEIGTILDFDGSIVDGYRVAPYGTIDQFILVENFLLLSDNESFLKLANDSFTFAGGLLKLAEATSTLGDTFEVTTPQGFSFSVEITSIPVPGREGTDPQTYLDNIREYSEVLRTTVIDAPTPIAGLYWWEDRLLAAVNALTIDVFVLAASTQPNSGIRVRWNGIVYRLVNVRLMSTGVTNHYEFALLPIGTDGTVNDQLVHINAAGTTGTVWNADVTGTGSPRTASTYYANLGFYNNATVSTERGFTYLTPASHFQFDAGNYADAITPPLTLQDGADADNMYYIVGAGPTVLKVRLDAVTQADGDFSAGTAEGFAQVTVVELISGTRDYVLDNDVLHSEYPTTGTSNVLAVNGAVTIAALAGTAAIDETQTRYMWGTFNFFGQSATLSAFGVNGAGRGFWANENGYGMIVVMEDENLDKPKYVSFHANRLVYGYKHGSVMLSVPGEFYNWQGLDGALEIGTGDDITGLLELPGDTLAVFGKRSIRKITGQTEADIQLTTVSGTSGCFDYTAVLIGQDAVFTTHNGITTLQQSASYGDFVGQRVSDPISTWLRPKLVKNRPGFEIGGTVCAYPVRSKSQYRLVLTTGEVVVATFTSEGPKLTFINPGFTGLPRVPYAISSEIAADGLERLHCRWTEEGLEARAYELDVGWGHDGRTFLHYFDTAHLFNNNSGYNMGVEKVRMYGQGYGVASLNITSSGIEDDFFQEYPETIQDISMPANIDLLYDRMRPVTSIIDLANWGLGIKLRIQGNADEQSTLTEPPHICQVLVLHARTEGAKD